MDQTPTPTPPRGLRLEFKAALLMLMMLLLVSASVLYLLYARGVFEATQRLVLVADDAEGVVVGMDMTFAGFPVGRVAQIELAPDGNVRIVMEVPTKDARWLRSSSVFTMERALVGGTRIRAFSGMLSDPPLPNGAERKLLRGDATAEIPRLVNTARELLTNLQTLTAADAALSETLANVKNVTGKLSGPQGALGVAFGNEADARKLVQAIERSNALLARLDGLVLKADQLAAKADVQVFGEQGVVSEGRATVVQLNGLLADARGSLKKVDGVLQEAQAIASNTREASTDLGALRAEVEGSLRKVEHLVNEVNRKWPFARDMEIKLP